MFVEVRFEHQDPMLIDLCEVFGFCRKTTNVTDTDGNVVRVEDRAFLSTKHNGIVEVIYDEKFAAAWEGFVSDRAREWRLKSLVQWSTNE